MHFLRYFFLIVSINCFTQNKVDRNDVHTENGITILNNTNKPYSGIVEHNKNNGHILFSEEFENGIKTKWTLYYNVDSVVKAEEKYFASGILISKIKYSLDKKKRWEIHYESNGNKKLEEDFVDEKLIYHCEYLNNKKNGKVVGVDKNGEVVECVYDNGKLIK